ncbi:MAG TPA: hypothetical protein VJ761_10330, partial [Ktedonobacteraceae bacterium]|nr:hypothetical protein [Ktedonobacteraceae bacterium]
MANEPEQTETQNELISLDKAQRRISFWKRLSLIGLAVLVVLSGATLLALRVFHRNTAPAHMVAAHSTMLSNSNGAMFGFDLQR